jgi:predicted P-loop ATPase
VNERRLWENDTTNLNRKVTFWGTTNLPYLYSGQNTRWISIPVKKINPDYDNYITGVKEVDIDSVWAEAYQAYMDGEDFQLNPQEMAFQEKLNQDWICGNEATGLVDTYIRTDEDSSWRSAEEIINSLAISNPNIIRRVTGRNLIEALKARNIPHKYEKNAHGYKCHLFNCVVTSEPQKYYESNNPTW